MNEQLLTKTSEILCITSASLPFKIWHPKYIHLRDVKFPFLSHEPLLVLLELNKENTQFATQLLQEIQSLNLLTRLIFIDYGVSKKQLLEMVRIQRPEFLLRSDQLEHLDQRTTFALNKARKLKQDQVLFELFNEQNEELKKISKDLEFKIKQRQMSLSQTQDKLSEATNKALVLQESLVAIHQSKNLNELENKLGSVLEKTLNTSWVKISYMHQGQSEYWNSQNEPHILTLPIQDESGEYARLLLARDASQPFSRQEKSLVQQLIEAIHLCVVRIQQIQKNNELSQQWQATFESISDSLILIDSNYDIRLHNRKSDKNQKKCFELLFDRDSPCKDCQLDKNFRIKQQDKIYSVTSQTIKIDHRNYYFNRYRNVSQQLGLERQLLESAKTTELGTIGSGIAHELNNPLGGMINFLQLIKMDLNESSELYEDVIEMEKGANKCKNIVQNLLGFTRQSDMNDERSILLKDVINQALLITELRTRAIGIKINIENALPNAKFFGRFNHISQVLCSLLQNSYESILTKRKIVESYKGEISISVSKIEELIKIQILDDGGGVQEKTKDQLFDPLFTTKDPLKNSGLGLTLAKQLVTEHGGQLQLSTQKDHKTCFFFTLPKTF